MIEYEKTLSKEEVFQRELYKLIYYLQDSEYGHTTRRDMLEEVMTNLHNEGCLTNEFHSRGLSNLMKNYNDRENVKTSMSELPTKIDEVLGIVNLIFWVK